MTLIQMLETLLSELPQGTPLSVCFRQALLPAHNPYFP